MKTNTVLFVAAQALIAAANPLPGIEARASCPGVHVFAARETTASPGYGSASTVTNLVTQTYSGSTSEAIDYPACGGQSSCGGVSYADSAKQGVAAVASAVNAFNQKCPNSSIVLVGYSQGGQIMDDALCGGGDTAERVSSTAVPLSKAAVSMVKAAIFMGDPRYVSGLSYEVGTCKAGGFDARPSGFSCPNAAKIQSYCDAADPYCCNGSDAATHQGYGTEYGQQALTFIKSKISV
ncbi:hypothetical protein VSDG_02814 [Cytospora chrysosperma]|uniref:Carbohydrate esterase family 5 protein n=1 Tax=Cytospora chrysosperma TaxID=252740 RepID=A0A423WD75_CYTCH|nr:hypothetical protein VSDG_02814 [Valsa sordida]